MRDDAYELYAPLDVLKPIGPDIWLVDGPAITFAYLGLKLPFPTRMTVVRLPDGAVWLHSPIQPTDALVESVKAIGPVRFLVAPNPLHYWWMPEWQTRFPDAETHAAPGLARHARRAFAIQHSLGDMPPSGWADTIDQAMIRGDAFLEIAFFHRPSRTLILTDLIENFEPSRARSRFFTLLMRLGGIADPDGKAPIDMRLCFLRHRKALRATVRRMIAWTPERIVVAHGRWYERNAVAELQRAFRWVL